MNEITGMQITTYSNVGSYFVGSSESENGRTDVLLMDGS